MQQGQAVSQALAFASSAVEADKRNDLHEALRLYIAALKYYGFARKYAATVQMKHVLSSTMDKYLTRAEEIKVVLSGGSAPKTTAAAVEQKVVKPTAAATAADAPATAVDSVDTEKLLASLATAIVMERPNVQWQDVAGLEVAKELLQEAVILPVRFPQLFTGNLKPWRAILLYGPPGTGKSYLAKAVATECKASCFLSVSSADLVSKYQGESERLVKNLFELARRKKPAIIFVDEIDSLCSARNEGENDSARRIKTEFLVQMQGVGKDNKDVLVLGATNTPWDLDQAMRRRFDKRVHVALPDAAARASIFQRQVAETPHSLTREHFADLGRRTEGYSGSDIGVVVRDALYEPVRTCQLATHFRRVPRSTVASSATTTTTTTPGASSVDYLLEPCSPSDPDAIEMSLLDVPGERLKPVDLNMRHFEMVLRNGKPSVAPSDLLRHKEWTTQFGQDG